MKRTLLVASFITAVVAAFALPGGSASAGLFGGKPAPTATPSAAPAPIPTATPEPPGIAIPRLQEKLKANPNDRDALVGLAQQYLAVGHPELSLPLTQKLLQLGEKTAQVYYFDGSAQAALGRVPQAIADLESASNLEPTNIGVLSTLADLYLKTNRPKDAERIANRAVTFNKTDPRAFTTLGIVDATEKKYDEARAQFEAAFKLDPKDVTPLLQEAQTYANQKALSSAVAAVDRARAIDPRNVQVLVFRADLLAQQNDIPKAAAAFDDAIAAATTDDDKVAISIRKAAMYVAAKQNAQADQTFQAAIAAYPKVASGYTAYGEYLAGQHQTPKAQQEFLQALQVNKDEPGALLDMAEIKLSSHQTTDAIGYLKHLGDVAPTAQAFALLGQAYIATHNYGSARDACSKSFQIQRAPETLGCVAGSDYSLKNYKEAAQIFDVLDANVKAYLDQNPQLLYMAGVSYTQVNQKSKAIGAYKRLLKVMKPGTKEYKNIQASINSLSKPSPHASKKKPG
ncbi:MAG TPA: tetratricopeptide repeat protein [Candidatus Baltobacteraceae bacterium]